MKVIVREMGRRPVISTPGRINAPQGAKALADLLADEDFADLCVLTLDWDGDGFTPAFVVETFKWVIELKGQRLTLEWVIDLDDAFGQDLMTHSILRGIVADLRNLTNEEVERRTAQYAG